MAEIPKQSPEDFVPPPAHVARQQFDQIALSTVHRIGEALGDSSEPVVLDKKAPPTSFKKVGDMIDDALEDNEEFLKEAKANQQPIFLASWECFRCEVSGRDPEPAPEVPPKCFSCKNNEDIKVTARIPEGSSLPAKYGG